MELADRIQDLQETLAHLEPQLDIEQRIFGYLKCDFMPVFKEVY